MKLTNENKQRTARRMQSYLTLLKQMIMREDAE